VSIGLLVQRAGARFGDRQALLGPDGSRTFAELAAAARRIAGGLLGLGLVPGDRVLELLPNSCATIESDLALATAGLVRVPLNPRLGPAAWSRIAADCSPAALIVSRAGGWDTAALESAVRHVIDDTARLPSRPTSAATDPLPDVGLDTLAGLAYSSGTTGLPKGAMRTHRGRIAAALAMTQEVLGGPPGPDATFLHAGPVIHTSGLFVLPFLMAGAPQVLLDHAGPDQIADAVERHAITHTALVPTMIARLLALSEPSRRRLAGLRMLAYAGAPAAPDLLRRAARDLTPHLVQYYGLVEAIPPITVLDEADHVRGLGRDPDLLRSAGRPCLAIGVRVVSPAGGVLADGEVGEVEIRGDPVTPGYWNAEHRTDLGKGVHDGWLRTGDIGRLGEGGRLWLLDRAHDMIITGGYNVYPREVEDVVSAVAGVDQVAAIGLPDDEWGQRLVVAFSCAPGASVSEPEVLAHCRGVLPGHQQPKAAYRFDTLPLGATGKVSRREVLGLVESRVGTG
jgi:acyl-CoA synthetase (AMP-forming)/AMP-acid ligase II